MFKSTYFASVLAAVCCCLAAFYLYDPPSVPVPTEMASLKQISRTIVKKVYAVETSEVCVRCAGGFGLLTDFRASAPL